MQSKLNKILNGEGEDDINDEQQKLEIEEQKYEELI